MSLLTVVTGACGRLGLPQPSVVVASTDRQVQQLYALANQAARELADAHNWQALMIEQTFVTGGSGSPDTVLLTDLDRFVPNTFWNRTTRREVTGPLTPQQWQAIKALPYLATVYLMYRERGGQFLMTPTPPSGQTIAFEYISTNICQSASGTPKAGYDTDTDLSYLDEDLIADSLCWRFLRAKGLDYGEEMSTFERNLAQAMARDGGSSALSMSRGSNPARPVNIPEGNFGL